MSWEPASSRIVPAGIENWYAAPLAVDGALAEPLRGLVATRVAVRYAVRGLLVRRVLAPHELDALRAAGVGSLELSQAFTALAAVLPQAARGTGPLGVMVRAMARVVSTLPDQAELGDALAMQKAIGLAVAHAIAEDLHPPSKTSPLAAGGNIDALMRRAVVQLLTARTIMADTLDRIGPLDRRLLASRLEERLPLMRAVVPPARGDVLEAIVRVAAGQLRLSPPVDAWTLDAALAGLG